jgi:hypothetical protein
MPCGGQQETVLYIISLIEWSNFLVWRGLVAFFAFSSPDIQDHGLHLTVIFAGEGYTLRARQVEQSLLTVRLE